MQQATFLPIAAWYTGGRARATMVRPPEPDSPVTWRQDLQHIRDCGFNSVRWFCGRRSSQVKFGF